MAYISSTTETPATGAQIACFCKICQYSAARNGFPYHVHIELFSNPNHMTG